MKFNSLIPELTVRNIEEAKSFYLNILNFNLEYERVEDKFAFVSLESNQIMLQEANGNWGVGELEYPFGRGVNFEMTVSNVEEYYVQILQKGITPFRPLTVNKYRKEDELIAQNEFLIQDQDGYLLRFTD